MYVEQDVIRLGDRCQHSQCQQWKSACVCTREIIGIFLCVCVCVCVFDIWFCLSDNQTMWRFKDLSHSGKFFWTVKVSTVLRDFKKNSKQKHVEVSLFSVSLFVNRTIFNYYMKKWCNDEEKLFKYIKLLLLFVQLKLPEGPFLKATTFFDGSKYWKR